MQEETKIFATIWHWMAQQKDHILVFTGILLSAMWGGFIRYASKSHAQKTAMKIGEFFFELGVSSFAGMVPGLLVYGFTQNVWLTCAASAYSGHLGTRQVFKILNAVLTDRFKNKS